MFIWGNTFLYLDLNTYAELKFQCFVVSYNQLDIETWFSFSSYFSY